jgi:hypothetical protein
MVIAMLRDRCFKDAELTDRLTSREPLRFRPIPGTPSAIKFEQLVPRPANDDGQYNTDEIGIVIKALVKDLEKVTRTGENDANDLRNRQEELEEALATVESQKQSIKSHETTENELKTNFEREQAQARDLRKELTDTRESHTRDLQNLDEKLDALRLAKEDVETRLNETQKDLDSVRSHLERSAKELDSVRQAKERVDSALNDLNASTAEAVQNFTDYRNSFQTGEKRIDELEQTVAAKEEAYSSLEKQLEQVTLQAGQERERLDTEWREKLRESEETLEKTWSEKLETTVQRECDSLRAESTQTATAVQEVENKWSQTLSRVLANIITKEDIPSDLLHLVLSAPFTAIDKFHPEAVENYVFVETYTGLHSDVSQVFKDDLLMVELLCWIRDAPFPSSIPTNALDRIVWLEKHLLEDLRVYSKRDGWILLAFSVLSKMVLSNSWPACCIAAVRLTVLSRQYPMYDMAEWDTYVAGLMNQYNQLNVDPLGQACLAYLCLTTSDPPACMAQNLPETLSQASFNATIPELVLLLRGRDVASADRNGLLSVVIVRRNDQEVVFSRSSTGWNLSMLPLEATVSAQGDKKIKWGPEPEQSIEVEGSSEIWLYVARHHSTTLIPQVRDGYEQRRLEILAKFDAMVIPELNMG